MRNIEFPQPRKNAKKIFAFLDYDHSGFLTLEELDPHAYDCIMRGDDVIFGDDCDAHKKGPLSMSFYERQSNHPIYVRKAASGKHRKAALEEADRARKKALMGAQNLDGFKAALVRKYGNLFRAWKLGLDLRC